MTKLLYKHVFINTKIFSDDKKNNMETKYNPINLFLDAYDYKK